MAMPNEGWIRVFHRAESQKVSTQLLLDIGSINRPDFGLACSIVTYYGHKKSCGGAGQENGQGLNRYSPSSACQPVRVYGCEDGVEGQAGGLERGEVYGLERGKVYGLEQGKVYGLEQGKVYGLE